MHIVTQRAGKTRVETAQQGLGRARDGLYDGGGISVFAKAAAQHLQMLDGGFR